ncbi:MAG: DinB family protein [Phycisphaerae bacterium]|nr:DinB family protein [Gemmatimonadaceae bacterium]
MFQSKQHVALIEQLTRVDIKRRKLLEDVSCFSRTELLAKADASTWSVLEIIEHLVLAENEVLGDLANPQQRSPLGESKWLPYTIVLIVLRFRIPVRAPSLRMLPTGLRSLADLSHEWDRHHSQLRAFVTTLKPDDLRRTWFRHPVAGALTVAQSLQMLEAHLDTHIAQVKRASGQKSARQVSPTL